MKVIGHFDTRNYRYWLRRLHTFTNEVESDPTKFDRGILKTLYTAFKEIGQKGFAAQANEYLSEVNGISPDARELILAMYERYVGLWDQNLSKAFATAEDSVDPRDNRGRKRKGIIQRIFEYLFGAAEVQSTMGYYIDEDRRVYPLTKLLKHTEQLVVTRVKVGPMIPWLDEYVWDYEVPHKDGGYTSVPVTPNQILKMIANRTYDDRDRQRHKERLKSASLDYPILMNSWGEGLIDGYHRLTKAVGLGRKTIRAKVLHGGIPAEAMADLPPMKAELVPKLAGIQRTKVTYREDAEGYKVRIHDYFRIGLLKYVKLLVNTMPAQFRREMDATVLRDRDRLKQVPRDRRLFLIYNAGTITESSPVCAAVEGRVLTADALMFVQQRLASALFHPNCRHHIVRSFDMTVDTYDGRYGEIMDLTAATALVGKKFNGKKIKLARKVNPHTISA